MLLQATRLVSSRLVSPFHGRSFHFEEIEFESGITSEFKYERTDEILGLTNKELGFLMARVGLGANLFFHGLVRLPKLQGFVAGMEAKFAESMLPGFMVTATAYTIPIVELLIGIALILGIGTRWALLATTIQMMVLTSGCCFVEDWGPINSQMFLLAMSAVMMANIDLNRLAITND